MNFFNFKFLVIPSLIAIPGLSANAELRPATFEDLGLAPDSHWVGDADDPDYSVGTFTSGSFEFANFLWADYDSWAWFGYANHGSPGALSGQEAQYFSTAGSGHDSDTYGIIYYASFIGPTWCTITDDTASGHVVSGLWVCNNAWTRDFIEHGDGFSPKFGTGDTLKLTVKGTSPDDLETSTSILLADCTSADPSRWSFADDWTWMDLSVLGPVMMLEFEIESSKQNQYGDLCPTYCCIDDLGAVETVAAKTIHGASAMYKVVSLEGGISVSSSAEGFSATLYDMAGGKTASGTAQDTNLKLYAPQGVYLLRMETPEGVETRKIRI